MDALHLLGLFGRAPYDFVEGGVFGGHDGRQMGEGEEGRDNSGDYGKGFMDRNEKSSTASLLMLADSIRG